MGGEQSLEGGELGPGGQGAEAEKNAVPETLGTFRLQPGEALAELVRALYGSGSALELVLGKNPGYRNDIGAGAQDLTLPAVLYAPPPSMTKGVLLSLGAFGTLEEAYTAWRGYTRTSIFGDAPAAAMDFFASDCPAKRMGDPEECAALALFLASGLARYITGAAIPVDGALSAGHQSISSWKHPEILTGGKLNSQSTIAALMENEAAKAIVEQYLPGFADNQQAKAAYGMTFGKIGPMLGLPETALKALLDALDNL